MGKWGGRVKQLQFCSNSKARHKERWKPKPTITVISAGHVWILMRRLADPSPSGSFVPCKTSGPIFYGPHHLQTRPVHRVHNRPAFLPVLRRPLNERAPDGWVGEWIPGGGCVGIFSKKWCVVLSPAQMPPPPALSSRVDPWTQGPKAANNKKTFDGLIVHFSSKELFSNAVLRKIIS